MTKPLRPYVVHRTLKGTQVYLVQARSKNDAVRKVIEGSAGEPVSFEITDAARTAIAFEPEED